MNLQRSKTIFHLRIDYQYCRASFSILSSRGPTRSLAARVGEREMNDGKSTVSFGASRRRRSRAAVASLEMIRRPMRFLSRSSAPRGEEGKKKPARPECFSGLRAAASRSRRGTAAREDARARLVSGSRACRVGERVLRWFYLASTVSSASSAATISACAGRPFLLNKPCCLPDQTVSPALETVTVMG